MPIIRDVFIKYLWNKNDVIANRIVTSAGDLMNDIDMFVAFVAFRIYLFIIYLQIMYVKKKKKREINT